MLLLIVKVELVASNVVFSVFIRELLFKRVSILKFTRIALLKLLIIQFLIVELLKFDILI